MKGVLEHVGMRALRVTQGSMSTVDMRFLVLVKYIRRLERALGSDHPAVIEWRERLNYNDPLVKEYFL
jgi:hypothetical protein